MKTKTLFPASEEPRDARLRRLGFFGLLARWDELRDEPWITRLLELEEDERGRRSLQRRLRSSRIGRFKPMADFDWDWLTQIDRATIEELLRVDFIPEASNVILLGPNGVGKTMIAKNLGYQGLLRGYRVLYVTLSELLNDLAARDTGSALERRLRRYTRPQLLVIDEVGYLATSGNHADLFFEVVARRYGEKSIVLTTNKPFTEWNQVFPSAGCVVTLIDRLVHKAEILQLDGESYRLKEARERTARRVEERKAREPA